MVVRVERMALYISFPAGETGRRGNNSSLKSASLIYFKSCFLFWLIFLFSAVLKTKFLFPRLICVHIDFNLFSITVSGNWHFAVWVVWNSHWNLSIYVRTSKKTFVTHSIFLYELKTERTYQGVCFDLSAVKMLVF